MPRVRTLEYQNNRGEPISAIVDSIGIVPGAPVVVIPPAWGRTKETLLPLASTIVETFASAGEPISVVRFDGTHRRGESYIHPRYRKAGDENLGFTFSQGVEDIHATVRFLAESADFAPTKVVLVSFSLAAIESRRAMATDETGLLVGWIPVVGMVDLQSGLRAVSGGVDYAFGLSRGVSFGHHELVGVVADMDATGSDALDHGLVFLEDAKRDVAKIQAPITWIHGRHDAWMDLGRVRELLSVGDSSQRRLLEVPTGHNLRDSEEALETFQLVAQEVSEFVVGRRLEPVRPSISRLEKRRLAERDRRPRAEVALTEFWADYLLGRDRRLGIELMTSTAAYRRLMDKQIELLKLDGVRTLVDLGAGTGGLLEGLERQGVGADGLRVISVDFVLEALKRQVRRSLQGAGMAVVAITADFESGGSVPLVSSSADAVLASLLVSYLSKPEALLVEAFRILRPRGRLVLSSLRPDADISTIYVEGVTEILTADATRMFGEGGEEFATLQREFLNDASRILDMEEAGIFRFRDAEELIRLVSDAGFDDVCATRAFGSPPQAIVVTGQRR